MEATTINNNNNNNIICVHHPNKVITHLCLSCGYDNFEPACGKCITSIHENHNLVEIDDVDDDLQIKINSKYYDVILPQLNNQLECNNLSLDELNRKYQEIKDNHTSNKNQISKQIKILIQRLQSMERDLGKQLDLKLNENNNIYKKRESELNNQIHTINNIFSNNNNNNNNNDYNENEQFLEMVNNVYKLEKWYNGCVDYNDYNIIIDQSSINTFDDVIKPIIKIKNQKLLKKKYGIEFYSYKDNDKIPDGTKCIAIKRGHHLPIKFPSSVDTLLLPDEFDQPINNLPHSINRLFIQNIKHRLNNHSIPNSITHVSFDNGFTQKITKGLIPESVEFGDVDQIPDIDSKSLYSLKFRNGFKHKITKGLIPEYVRYLEFGYIDQIPDIDSFPRSVYTLKFSNGFKHKITKKLIPKEYINFGISFGNIVQPLDIDSIPQNVLNLTFEDGFKHKIIKQMIPKSVRYIFLGDILQPLVQNSIPDTIINKIIFSKKFKHKICKETIQNVKEISIGDVVQPLDINSIPDSVTKLRFEDGYKHKIVKGIIPLSVKYLILGNIIEPLDIDSIPNSPSLTSLSFGNFEFFNHKIVKGIIPPCIKNLEFYKIKYQPDIESIPNTVEKVYTSTSFNHSLDGILPNGTSHIKGIL